MTYSLNIQGGDLSLGGPGGLSVVSGTDKLIQDLKCWLLEPMGTDPLHPDYGSILDGGATPGSSVSAGMIGTTLDGVALLRVEAEVTRVLNLYQRQQINRLQIEQSLYNGKNTYTHGEILASVDSVIAKQFKDTIIVNVVIRTANGQTLTFSQPLGGTGTTG